MFNVQLASKASLAKYITEILKIDEENFQEEKWGENNFLKPLEGKFENSYVAFLNNVLVGYCINYIADPNSLHVSRIALKKDLKGQGFGKKLIEEVVRSSKKKGFKKITLEFEKKFAVEHFYKKQGFQPLEEGELNEYLEKKGKSNIRNLYVNPDSSRSVMKLNLLN